MIISYTGQMGEAADVFLQNFIRFSVYLRDFVGSFLRQTETVLRDSLLDDSSRFFPQLLSGILEEQCRFQIKLPVIKSRRVVKKAVERAFENSFPDGFQ